MRLLFLTLSTLLTISFSSFGTTYYYAGGGLNLANTSNWGTNTDGSGINPTDFSASTDIFDLYGHNGPVNSNWNVGGYVTSSNGLVVITIATGINWTTSGDFTNIGSIAVQGSGTAAMTFSGGSQSIPIIVALPTLQIGGTLTKFAQESISVTNLIFAGTASLNMQTHQLGVTTVFGSGAHALYTQNTGSTPISAITYPSSVLVDFNAGATQTIPANTAFDGDLTVSSSTITALSDLSVDGTLTVSGNGVLDMDTYAVTGSGSISGTGTSTFLTGNTSTTPFPENSTFYNLQFDGASDQSIPVGTTVNNTIGFTANQTVTALGDLSVGASIGFLGNASLDMSTYQLTGAVSTISFSGTHTFRTAYTGAGLPYPADLNFTLSTFTVEFYGTGDQTIPGGTSSATTIYNLSLTGTGVKTLDNNHQLTIGSSGGTLNIEPGVGFETTSGTTFNLNGTEVTLQANATSYAQIKIAGTYNTSNSPSFNKQHYLDVSTPRYFNLGAGVSGATFDNLPESGASIVASSGSDGSVWYWSADNSNWTAPSNTSDAMSAFIGFTVFGGSANGTDFLRASSGTISVEGTGIISGDQVQGISYDDGSSSTATLFDTIGTGWGWNFYSNPYTATYDWDGQTLPPGVTDAIYIWNGTNYSAYNGVGINGGSRYIAPGQAFWVQATSSMTSPNTWTMAYSQTTTSQSPSFLKLSPDFVKLELRDSDGQILDESAVRFEPTATTQFDGQFDARKLPSSVGTPYTHIALNGEHYGICTTPNSTTDFPVTLKLNGGPNVLTFTLNEDNFSEFTDAILEDKSNGQFTQLMRGGSYSFTVNANDPEDRFVLHFNNNSVGIDEFGNTPITVGVASNQLFLFNQNVKAGSPVSGSILDLNGRTISQFNAEASTDRTTIQLPSLAAGIYMVRLSANNQTWTERIIIQ